MEMKLKHVLAGMAIYEDDQFSNTVRSAIKNKSEWLITKFEMETPDKFKFEIKNPNKEEVKTLRLEKDNGHGQKLILPRT